MNAAICSMTPETGDLADQAAVTASGGEYAYQFVEVFGGNCVIAAGTDSDNDYFICNPGEVCGVFLTSDQPQVVSVDQDLADVNFPVEQVIAIPAHPFDANAAAPSGYTRLVEPTKK